MPISGWQMENKGSLCLDTWQVHCDSLTEFQNKKYIQNN